MIGPRGDGAVELLELGEDETPRLESGARHGASIGIARSSG